MNASPMRRRLVVDRPFDLDAVLDGTQDFRWHTRAEGWRSGVLSGNLLHLRAVEDGLEYRAHGDLDALLRSYFRLDDDVDAIHAELSERDDRLATLVKRYPHLRVLAQPDPWECVVAYICSANNSIERIAAIVEKVANRLGRPVELDGDVRHVFPTPEQVLEAGVGALEELRLGLDRHSNIIAAAERICDGRLDLDGLARPEVGRAEAERRLKTCRGIGDKIAACIALFALDKPDAFPVDVWISRGLEAYFPSGGQPSGGRLAAWARDRFGRHAGHAGQLLFQEQRELDARRAAT